MRTIHVYVRLKAESPNEWPYEWRQVQARDLDHAFDVAEEASDVEAVLEVSYVAGGVVT